jgi:hypothetical protein
MKRKGIYILLIAIAITTQLPVIGFSAEELSIKYINAAIGSFYNNQRVVVRGTYSSQLKSDSMWEGYSQFKISDDLGNSFGFMYCTTGGDVFKTLLDAKLGTRFKYLCNKGKIRNKYNDCLVTIAIRLDDSNLASSSSSVSAQKYTVAVTRPDGSTATFADIIDGNEFLIDSYRITIRGVSSNR